MDYFSRMKLLFNGFLKLTAFMAILSPLLLMSYLNIFDSISFFPLLISEGYILSTLATSSILISIFITILYLTPYNLLKLLNNKSTYQKKTFSFNGKIFRVHKKTPPNPRYKFSTIVFLVSLFITCELFYLFMYMYDQDNSFSSLINAAIFLFIYYIAEMMSYNYKRHYQYIIKEDPYFILTILIAFPITIMALASIFLYATKNFNIYNLILLASFLCMAIYLFWSLSKDKKIPIDNKISVLLPSFFIVNISLIMCFIYINKVEHNDTTSGLLNFSIYVIFIVIAPNYLLSIKKRDKKIVLSSLYLISLVLCSNIFNFMIYETFKFMKLTHEESLEVHITKAKVNTSIKYDFDKNIKQAYIIYQTEKNIILCSKTIFDKRPHLFNFSFEILSSNKNENKSEEPDLTNESKCFLAKSEDITFI